MANKYLSVISVLVCAVLVKHQVDLAEIGDKVNTRHKRTILSTISNWWYGEPTTQTPIEDLPFRDEINYIQYPYYNPTGLGGYPIQYVPQPASPHSDDDLGRLARELGIRNIRNLPKIEDVMGLLGTNTKDETIQAIREFAATPGGVDMIESFLDTGSDEVTEEYQPINHVKQEVVHANPVPVQNIIPTETVEKLPESLRAGVHQPKALVVPSPGSESTDTQKLSQTIDRFATDMQLVEQGPPVPTGFFGRLGYYASFLNPFSLRQSVDVPLPEEKLPTVTVRPVVYRYPEGYDPHTKSFTNTKNRVELLESEHKRLSGEKVTDLNYHAPSPPAPYQGGPFVRYPQEIQPLIRTPQHQYPHNAIVNAPIPAYIYQSGPGNPYFVDQHPLAGVAYPVHPAPVQTVQVQPPQPQPVRIDLTNDEYSPSQVEALRQQQQIAGQFVTVPLPPVVNSAVSDFNGDEGSYSLDVRFGHPITVVDHVASGSEVHETVVAKDENKKVEETKKDDTVTDKTTAETVTKEKETLKLIPVHTTATPVQTTTTLTSTTTELNEKKEEKPEESKLNIVTVLPDNDFTFETFDAPKEIGQKVIESVSNLTAESLSAQQIKDKEE